MNFRRTGSPDRVKVRVRIGLGIGVGTGIGFGIWIADLNHIADLKLSILVPIQIADLNLTPVTSPKYHRIRLSIKQRQYESYMTFYAKLRAIKLPSFDNGAI